MRKFEYMQKAVDVQARTSEIKRIVTGSYTVDFGLLSNADLTPFGLDGWELVSAVPITMQGSTWVVVLMFRRELE